MPSSKLGFGLLSLLLLLLVQVVPAFAQQAAPARVAVLPFEVNAEEDLLYLRDSLPELLRDKLVEAGFEVVDAATVDQAVAEAQLTTLNLDSARQIALTTGATHALYGTFSQLGDALSLEARFVDAFGLEPAVPVLSNKDGLINLLPLMDDVVAQVKSSAMQEDVIAALDVEGTRVLDKDVVLIRMRLQKGDDYTPKAINDELKNIYDLGYFDDVQVQVTDVTGGKRVVFVVKEKPRIQSIGMRGADHLDKDELLEIIGSKTGAVLNPKVLKRDLATVSAFYKHKGYYKTKVNYEVEGGDNGQAKLVFVIEEGEKLYIEKIIFDGVAQVDEDELRDALSLSEKGFFWWIDDSGKLNEELLDRDGAAVQAFYANRGFLNVKVSRPEVDIRDDGIYVTFRVEEGDRYRISNVGFKGDIIVPENELKDLIKTDEILADEEDQYLNAETVRTDVETLTNFYTNRGYAYADVGAKYKPDEETKSVEVLFMLTKHQRVHIRRVFLEGNTSTRDNVILRNIKLADGDEYNGAAIEGSIKTLENLDYFAAVDVEPIPTGDPAEMDLKVAVQEKPTGAIGGGVGYSSTGGVYLAGSITERNLMGKGYNLTLSGKFGGDTTGWDLDFYNPRVNDEYWGLGLSSSLTYTSEPEYEKDSLSSSIKTLHALGPFTLLTFQYGLEFYNLHDIEPDAADSIQDDEGEHAVSAFTTELSRTTVRKNSFFKSDGTNNAASVTFGGGVLGGSDHFVKWGYNNDYYEPIVGDLVLHTRGRVGFLHETIGDTDVPVSQRFSLGGISTVRGYSRSMISARDENGDRIGGNKYLVGNVEMMYPLDKDYGILGLIFFDAGNTWKEGEWFFEKVTIEDSEAEVDPSLGLYKSIGTGLRWMSPMGPLQLEYGYALDELDDSGKHKVEFMMGQSF